MEAANEVNALQLQPASPRLLTMLLPERLPVASCSLQLCVGVRVYCGCCCCCCCCLPTCKSARRSLGLCQVFIHEIGQIAPGNTGVQEEMEADGGSQLIACSSSVHFQQHQGSNALNTSRCPHRMLPQQNECCVFVVAAAVPMLLLLLLLMLLYQSCSSRCKAAAG